MPAKQKEQISSVNHGIRPLKPVTRPGKLLRAVLSDRMCLSLMHMKKFGRWPQIDNPRTFNEHLLHTMLVSKPDLCRYTDKYAVREFVAEKIGSGHLEDIYLVTDDPELPWDALPARFVISATHGSGMTMIINDKSTVDRNQAASILSSWLKEDFSVRCKEPIYKGITPRLIVKENLSDDNGAPPADYKIFCFGGVPRYIQIHVGRFQDHRIAHYDTEWKFLPLVTGESTVPPPLPRPAQLDNMLEIARKLSSGFDFVRVDLYQPTPDRVVFGELTFLPSGAREKYDLDSYDWAIGKLFTEARKSRTSTRAQQHWQDSEQAYQPFAISR